MSTAYEKIGSLMVERDALKAQRDALAEVLACAKGLLAWKDKQFVSATGDTCGPFGYIRDTDESRKQIRLLEAAIQQATGDKEKP